MKKFIVVVFNLWVSSVAAQTLPQPSTKGNAPTIVCVTLQTATSAQFKGAPVTFTTPACFGLSDVDVVRLLNAFGAVCSAAIPGQQVTPPPCTTDQINVAAASYLRDRLLDYIVGYDRQQALTNIQPPVAVPAN
jgi:hypothetical protein